MPLVPSVVQRSARGEREVLTQLIEQTEAVLVADLFLEALHAAEFTKRPGTRCVLTHPPSHVLGDLTVYVVAKLVVDFTDGSVPE